MTLARRVEPEWLDRLPAHDPRALRSRRDILRLNGLMGHAAIMALLLARHGPAGGTRTILDLGGSDGIFMLRVARRLAPRWPAVRLVLVDRHDVVTEETRAAFAALGWTLETVIADVFAFLAQGMGERVDVVTSNLFLHQFEDEQIVALTAGSARHAPLFVACEPRRGRTASAASRLVWAVGCAEVTRYDAVVSVRGGFRGKELSALWPTRNQETTRRWDLSERAAWPFTHCFVAAERRASAAHGRR
jgi:hypothetical protein